ncbi:hypothetical protein KUTeg_011842 [Tegillarca granosa]|uniref:Uncharacterized protein n=1 Tax=Tegillarca granosa TaxID=220873 RepID=A0ABQ9F131_TEGGR|nr:hypothetical protein KUTeg_011842 [Tegillarca granosa]
MQLKEGSRNKPKKAYYISIATVKFKAEWLRHRENILVKQGSGITMFENQDYLEQKGNKYRSVYRMVLSISITTSLHRSAENFEARQHTEVFLYGHTCKTSTDGGREKRVSNYTDLTKRLSLYVILNLSTKFLVHHQTPFMSLRSDYRHESVDLLLSKHKINNRSIMGQLVTELMTIV